MAALDGFNRYDRDAIYRIDAELKKVLQMLVDINIKLDAVPQGGGDNMDITLTIDPATLAVLVQIFGGDAAVKIAALTAQLKTESTTLETAVDTAQQPPVADKRP